MSPYSTRREKRNEKKNVYINRRKCYVLFHFLKRENCARRTCFPYARGRTDERQKKKKIKINSNDGPENKEERQEQLIVILVRFAAVVAVVVI
jgi:hypothetical protein